MTDRGAVERWLAGYEAAWRAPGTEALADLFTADAVYLRSPYAQPVTGLAEIGWMWEAEREGPDEAFSLATEILAVDGPVAVVRAEVRYGEPSCQEYRDLWVIRLDEGGRCTWFEEWPFWPERPYAAPGGGSRLPPARDADLRGLHSRLRPGPGGCRPGRVSDRTAVWDQ